MASALDRLVHDIRACRICVERPLGPPLPHEPRPVLRVSSPARLCIGGQAPGTRVHASGVPFSDPSGDRLRAWLGVTPAVFYDEQRIAIVPMGFCFPGLDSKGGDLPPRPECAAHWRQKVFDQLGNIELILMIGQYAQSWHLKGERRRPVTAVVEDWQRILETARRPRLLPLPHPSWRNNAWLKSNPWFEAELLPLLRVEVRRLIDQN
jgi:uracil-DNA glycosylase